MISLVSVTIHSYYCIINPTFCAVHYIPVTYSITGTLHFLISCTFLPIPLPVPSASMSLFSESL